ncbi:MAG: carboxypeptidase-like regulatory domain-containing protein [Croceivirga sp.]
MRERRNLKASQIAICYLSVFILLITHYKGFSQESKLLEKKVTITFSEVTIPEALQQLETEANIFFSYESSAVNTREKISKSYSDALVRSILDDIFSKYKLYYAERNGVVYIQKFARKGTISGKVYTEEGKPIPFASVYLKNTSLGVASDENGRFSLKAPEGSYILAVSVMGYAEFLREIKLQFGETIELKIPLRTTTNSLQEVKVFGQTQKERIEQTALAVTVLETEEAKLKSLDLGGVLARVQGVNVRRSGGLGAASSFSLNGFTGRQVRFFIDGIPLDFVGVSNNIANIPVNLLDRVEIYRGVVPIKFGADALGGAVNLVTSKTGTGTRGDVSYQVGSFNTHRVAANLNFNPKNSKLYATFDGFFDYSNNDYQIEVDLPVATGPNRGQIVPTTVNRFHDDYRAFGATAVLGLSDTLFNSNLSFRAFYFDSFKEIQNNNFMTIPYGEPITAGNIFGTLLKWEKQWSERFDFDITAGWSLNRRELVDTSTCVFNWLGECIANNNPGEIDLFTPFDQEIQDYRFVGRFNLRHLIGKNGVLSFNSSPNYTERTGNNRRITDPNVPDILEADRRLFNLVNGLDFSWSIPDKLKHSVFVKNYLQRINAQEIGLLGTNDNIIERNSTEVLWGGGTNVRWPITEYVAIKASYEYTARIPTAAEVFGDGILTRPNLDLRPERSHNVNLGVTLSDFYNKDWQFELNGFYRDAEDLILLLAFGNILINNNVFSSRSVGAECSWRYAFFDKRLVLSGNATYQDFRNTSGEGAFGAFEGDRIPNQPYFFANFLAQYQLSPDNAINGINLFLDSRYVNEFFFNWESISSQNRPVIPSQFTTNIGATWSGKLYGKDLSITGEVQNIFDADVFDLFSVQLPGRAFFIKTNIQL